MTTDTLVRETTEQDIVGSSDGKQPTPLAELDSTFAADEKVLKLDAKRMELAGAYDRQDGELLKKIRDELMRGENAGSGKWTRYVELRGLTLRTANARIAAFEGHSYDKRAKERAALAANAADLPEGESQAEPTDEAAPKQSRAAARWQDRADDIKRTAYALRSLCPTVKLVKNLTPDRLIELDTLIAELEGVVAQYRAVLPSTPAQAA